LQFLIEKVPVVEELAESEDEFACGSMDSGRCGVVWSEAWTCLATSWGRMGKRLNHC